MRLFIPTMRQPIEEEFLGQWGLLRSMVATYKSGIFTVTHITRYHHSDEDKTYK
jgi:hypothetical protein